MHNVRSIISTPTRAATSTLWLLPRALNCQLPRRKTKMRVADAQE